MENCKHVEMLKIQFANAILNTRGATHFEENCETCNTKIRVFVSGTPLRGIKRRIHIMDDNKHFMEVFDREKRKLLSLKDEQKLREQFACDDHKKSGYCNLNANPFHEQILENTSRVLGMEKWRK